MQKASSLRVFIKSCQANYRQLLNRHSCLRQYGANDRLTTKWKREVEGIRFLWGLYLKSTNKFLEVCMATCMHRDVNMLRKDPGRPWALPSGWFWGSLQAGSESWGRVGAARQSVEVLPEPYKKGSSILPSAKPTWQPVGKGIQDWSRNIRQKNLQRWV